VFVHRNVYHISAGTLYISRHKRKLGCDLARVNMIACLPCLALYCELAAYQPRLALIWTFLDSGSRLITVGTARLYRGCSKRHTSQFSGIFTDFYKFLHTATWMSNQAVQKRMPGNGIPGKNFLLVFNDGKSVCLPEKINVVMDWDYRYGELFVYSIKLPINYFLTDNCGDLSNGNKQERNLLITTPVLECNWKYCDRAFCTITGVRTGISWVRVQKAQEILVLSTTSSPFPWLTRPPIQWTPMAFSRRTATGPWSYPLCFIKCLYRLEEVNFNFTLLKSGLN